MTDETQLWDRERVNRLKATALVMPEHGMVMFERDASPADSLQAGKEMGFPHFSHLINGYPVYSR